MQTPPHTPKKYSNTKEYMHIVLKSDRDISTSYSTPDIYIGYFHNWYNMSYSLSSVNSNKFTPWCTRRDFHQVHKLN